MYYFGLFFIFAIVSLILYLYFKKDKPDSHASITFYEIDNKLHVDSAESYSVPKEHEVYAWNSKIKSWEFQGVYKMVGKVTSTSLIKFIAINAIEYKIYKFNTKKGRYKFLKREFFPSNNLPIDNLDYKYVRYQELTTEDLSDIASEKLLEKIAVPVILLIISSLLGFNVVGNLSDEFSFTAIVILILGVVSALLYKHWDRNRLRNN